jgi:polyhydroxyalkanoate synthesis regulator phasin
MDEHRQGEESRGGAEGAGRRAGATLGEGLRTGIGILSALKDAIEETIQEAVERGDLKPERAKQAVRDATRRAQDGLGEVREKLDFVPRRLFDDLRDEVAALRDRVDRLEGRGGDTGTP